MEAAPTSSLPPTPPPTSIIHSVLPSAPPAPDEKPVHYDVPIGSKPDSNVYMDANVYTEITLNAETYADLEPPPPDTTTKLVSGPSLCITFEEPSSLMS